MLFCDLSFGVKLQIVVLLILDPILHGRNFLVLFKEDAEILAGIESAQVGYIAYGIIRFS
jgi:hypothetical protein